MKVHCADCPWEGDVEDAAPAKDLGLRHEIGDRFSDVECPKCGALAFPPAEPSDQGDLFAPVMGLELFETLAQAAREFRDDLVSGVEDGAYEDDEDNAKRIAELEQALGAVEDMRRHERFEVRAMEREKTAEQSAFLLPSV